MQNYRIVVILLMLVSSIIAEQPAEEVKGAGKDRTSNTTILTTKLVMSTTDSSTATPELEWVTFPPGDVLNDPWFKKIKFVFPQNETIVQGLRNGWPYVDRLSAKWRGRVFHGMRILNKARHIAVDPILRTKLYCFIMGYPVLRKYVYCFPGNSTIFSIRLKSSPIGMLRDNIPLSVFTAILAFLSLVLGIFGNILIIVSILTKKELKSSTNLILVGIAVADCLNSATIVFHGYLETFLWTITNPVLGPTGCGFIRALKEFSQLSAVNHLITLSFERYFAICWPMHQSLKFTQRKTILVIIANWIISGIQLIPFVVLRVPMNGLDYAEYMCHGSTPYPRWIYIFYNLTVYLVLPVPILCFNYVCVGRNLFISIKKSRNVADITADSNGQTQAEKARLKMIYMMIALVAIYVVTVTPGRIMDALHSLWIVRFHGIFYIKKVRAAFDLVRGMNSWTNVVVYALISRQFRVAFKDILCRCWRKPSGGIPEQGNQNGIEETAAETQTMENQV